MRDVSVLDRLGIPFRRRGSRQESTPIVLLVLRHNSSYPGMQVRRLYLNNIVEQDHRGVKRVTRPMLGFKAFETAQDTLVGIELMHMIKKKQLVLEAGDEGLTAAELFYSLAA